MKSIILLATAAFAGTLDLDLAPASGLIFPKNELVLNQLDTIVYYAQSDNKKIIQIAGPNDCTPVSNGLSSTVLKTGQNWYNTFNDAGVYYLSVEGLCGTGAKNDKVAIQVQKRPPNAFIMAAQQAKADAKKPAGKNNAVSSGASLLVTLAAVVLTVL
ncbi:hypothetical protein HDV04_004500 [Boothiomyces sp. JEL0838]|nr:hypothetical protein HDV04_004500 [Boothiomyces sp. JEL0838]